jgi:hypothetical protein
LGTISSQDPTDLDQVFEKQERIVRIDFSIAPPSAMPGFGDTILGPKLAEDLVVVVRGITHTQTDLHHSNFLTIANFDNISGF